MSKKILIKGQTEIPNACNWLSHWLAKGLEGGKPVTVKLSYETRTEAQNRHLWPLLRCFVDQKEYSGRKFDEKGWKLIMLSAYKSEPTGVIIGINGEVVNTNLSSSDLNKHEFSELIELIYAQGSEWGIQWSDPALKTYEEWGIK